MGQTNWTSEQREIIDARNENILVSAAAGSGKTTVLVERIFQRMTDPVNPVGIDRFVVVTFTNLAAAQMKDRLRRRIDEELAAHRIMNIWPDSQCWFPRPIYVLFTVSVVLSSKIISTASAWIRRTARATKRN